jgi:hypothetical protein
MSQFSQDEIKALILANFVEPMKRAMTEHQTVTMIFGRRFYDSVFMCQKTRWSNIYIRMSERKLRSPLWRTYRRSK